MPIFVLFHRISKSLYSNATNKSFDGFFRHVKNGEKAGFPRYRKRVRSVSRCLRKNKKGERQNPIIETEYRHNSLKVPKLGEVKMRMHRLLQGDPKEVTLVKKASWVVCPYQLRYRTIHRKSNRQTQSPLIWEQPTT